MNEAEKHTLDDVLSVFLRMCEKTDCKHCPLTLFFHPWEICPVEVIAHLLNQAEHPERTFETCIHVKGGNYCRVKWYYREQCNCCTCEQYEPKAGEA